MSKPDMIPGTDEAWESGALGEDAKHARLAPQAHQRAVRETLAMQAISLRLPVSVIEDFKALASLEGIGYQPLMREALIRFAQCESKKVMHHLAAAKKQEDAQRQASQTDKRVA